MIQLYCSVQGTSTATFSWFKDGSQVEIDIPHLRERTTTSAEDMTSMSMLTIETFQSADNGAYGCMAEDGGMSGNGATTNLTGILYSCFVMIRYMHMAYIFTL